MRFCSIHATFGTLEQRTLTFAGGLNVIEAPNESGKSTLTAFLRVMLYGLPARERGTLADKNRYAPWSGAPMSGTLSLESERFGAVTLQRDTARANLPMGRFSALRTGSSDPVSGLSAADCGEALLGVPREVYERSAFIRQSGLAVDADAELEKRIAALITSGEEGVSYSEAAAALRRQLNARRANVRTGAIPTLEQEIARDEAAENELRELSARGEAAADELRRLRDEEERLRAALHAHELADRLDSARERENARRAADEADAKAEVFYRMIADAHTPEKETLESRRSALRALDDLSALRADAEQKHANAEAALADFDAQPPERHARGTLALVVALLTAVAAAALCVLLRTPWPLALLALGAALAVLSWSQRKRALAAEAAHADERGRLEAAVREAEAERGALGATYESQLAAALEGLNAADAPHALAYIEENLARYGLLEQLEREAQEKRLRSELLDAQPLADVPAGPVERPAQSREALAAALAAVRERSAALQREKNVLEGRGRAIGDGAELAAALAQKRERLRELQEEYDAIALAAETLSEANDELANRFSPELSRRAAELFAALTGGKYVSVLLDRALNAMIAKSGESASHDAALLSQGASDQLYLAVRLAICDMVLPEDVSVPLVLDDALINFDDDRCRAALEVLERESARRQILLLTCQSREAAFLRGHENVTFLTL